jgi:hypothetical protein
MIKKNIFLRWLTAGIFTLVLTLTLGGPGFSADVQLKLNLLLDKSEYSLDEPINVILSLKNLGPTPVMVNQRFYISAQQASGNQKEVYFDLVSPAGVKLACRNFYETGYPKSDYFKLLVPNEEVKSEYPRNLKGFFEIMEPGTYTINAVYQNVFGEEIGLDVFKGQLVSEPVKFTIVKTKK